ncbi:hypothetical protein Zmor_003680 [Zophobas morio]|uniref:RNA-directed DNA polymerase n=1 Tax=Zophobas morio TaxID=2755281 RepID=A0AA38HNB5_9CUCU|nr:hypothetical protein Zmor_003680 [Zophobas morio]
MASGYFQVEFEEEDKEISAFSTPKCHYEFNHMAMGLRNAPSTWQRLMYAVFSGLIGSECLAYLDDVIVFSNNDPQEHIKRLKDVFIRMREFLGLCGFYRKFVPKFSEIARPLSDLTKKGTPFEWYNNQQGAFNALKEALVNPPILKYPDFTRPFVLATDASGVAVSAILAQKYSIEHPICYATQASTLKELNCAIAPSRGNY